MFTLTLSILLANLQIFACNYLEAEANYLKPKLERNNIVNKGVWVRNKFRENLFEKTSLGNFIFEPSSLDADRLLQTNFGTFADNDMEETPTLSGYVERVRRSPDQIRKRHSRKSLKSKNLKNSIEDSKIYSKSVPNLEPASVFNDYPYEVAILLNNNRKQLIDIINENKNNNQLNTTAAPKIAVENTTVVDKNTENGTETTIATLKEDIDLSNAIKNNVSPPKRSRKHNYGIDNNEPFNIIKDFNDTDANEKSKTNRNVFDKEDRVWHQNAPIPDTNVYEVVPKDREKAKGVTEKGLIRVISMLTKTFKKITKQHNEVKQIYDKFNYNNDDFIKKMEDMNAKIQDFESKYSDMIQFNNKMRAFEDKLANEVEYLKTKQKTMDDNIVEFENQQKKFLAQQKQFYSVQKVMLAQNEKINMKQSTIAKTQSEISHRQNNFARILKKTKQILIDNRKPNVSKEDDVKYLTTKYMTKTTTTPIPKQSSTTESESIKLNLFSIPTKNKLSNQDDLIIKEKDQSPIDDLVYKYYFNNTFIDNLMKSKILNNYASNTNSIDIARHAKNKRDEEKTTILLPVNDLNHKNRVRRWINPLLKNKKQKKEYTKVSKTDLVKVDAKSDPFLTMAKSFCNEIGQNTNDQTLNWCIEKALRRLRFMDKRLFSKPVTVMNEKKAQILNQVTKEHTTEKTGVTLYPVAPSTIYLATNMAAELSTPLYAIPSDQAIFFPDNEELESNLKQYDLTPDTEGTVYYDGSLHLSDIAHGQIAHESDGMSDFMPGLVDSNSQVEMNPLAFDLQAKRRAYVKRLNEDLMQKYKSRKL